MYQGDENPTVQMGRVPTSTGRLIPRMDELEEQVTYVKAPASPFKVALVAVAVFFAFMAGIGVALWQGVDVPVLPQAETPATTTSAPATKKPERDPGREVPVKATEKPARGTKTNTPETPTEKPATVQAPPTHRETTPPSDEPSPTESAPSTMPTAEPPADPAEETPPVETEEPETEVPSTIPATQTSQSAGTSEPTP